MKKLILLLVITMSVSGQIFSQEKKVCKVTLSIEGDAKDGTGFSASEISVFQRCYEFSAEEMQKQILYDKKKYDVESKKEKWYEKAFFPILGYSPIGDPSVKQDCAGYTLQRLQPNVEKLWITAQVFYDQLISIYAKRVSTPDFLGDFHPGDVLMYMNGKNAIHVTYVTEAKMYLSWRNLLSKDVTVATKNEDEGVFLHTIRGSEKNTGDPLAQNCEFVVYRFPQNFHVEVKSRECKCEEIPKPPFLWFVRLNKALIDFKTNPYGFNGERKMKIGSLAEFTVEIQNIPKDPQKRYTLEIWKEDANGRERLASVGINKNEDFGKLSTKYTTDRVGNRTNLYGMLVEDEGNITSGFFILSDVGGFVDWEGLQELPKIPFLWVVKLNGHIIDYLTKANGVQKSKIGKDAQFEVEIQNIPKDPQKEYALEIWKADVYGEGIIASASITKGGEFGKLSAKYTTDRVGDRTGFVGKLVEIKGDKKIGSMMSDVGGYVDWEK